MKKMVKKKMGGTTKKYEDGGKVTRADIKNAQREAKLKRIEAGTEPSTYEKVANISGNVAKTAVAAGEAAKAIRDTRAGTTGGSGMKKGGAIKKYQDGGRTISQKAAARKTAKGKGFTDYVMGTKDAPGSEGNKGTYVPFTRQGRKDAKKTGMVSSKEMKSPRKVMKTGGMVNSNSKVSALKSAGSDGVKSGVNPKVAASKVARGKVGGISSAPKTAVPKAKYGMSMRKK
jgi:hypothetical protein